MFSFFFALHNTHLNDDVTRAMSLYQLVSYYPSFFLGRKNIVIPAGKTGKKTDKSPSSSKHFKSPPLFLEILLVSRCAIARLRTTIHALVCTHTKPRLSSFVQAEHNLVCTRIGIRS